MIGVLMPVLGSWLCIVQQLSLGRAVSMHTAQPLPCHRADPILGGRAWADRVILETFLCLCAKEGGESQEQRRVRRKAGGRREPASRPAEGSQRQTAHAALWLVCNSKDNIHWLYSLNCWRTDMTPNCCFYVFLLIGTKGKCPWLAFLFWTDSW